MGEVKKKYKSKSLTNRLYLKKQLPKLKMNGIIDVNDYTNKFNKYVTQVLRLMRNIKLLFYYHPYKNYTR